MSEKRYSHQFFQTEAGSTNVTPCLTPCLAPCDVPDTYHGCYYYNNGEFPYAIKESLSFLLLENGDDYSLTKIIGVSFEPGVRFRFQGEGKTRVEDANGDSCIWEIRFEVVPVPAKPRHYLMRRNPSISSFTEEDYK